MPRGGSSVVHCIYFDRISRGHSSSTRMGAQSRNHGWYNKYEPSWLALASHRESTWGIVSVSRGSHICALGRYGGFYYPGPVEMAEFSLPAVHLNAPGAAGCHLKATDTSGGREPHARTGPLAYSLHSVHFLWGDWLFVLINSFINFTNHLIYGFGRV